jgi:hypothetical protein
MQTLFSPYMPSLLHILKMMMNVITTLQPTTKYSTRIFSLFFSTPLLVLFFLAILLLPPIFVYAHSSAFPFPLLFFVVFQWHYLHHAVMNYETSKMRIISNNKRKLL